MKKRIVLFDIDGTLTKPRNVVNILAIENRAVYEGLSCQIKNSYRYRISRGKRCT